MLDEYIVPVYFICSGPFHVGEFIISGHRILHENSDFSVFLHGGDSSDLSELPRFADMKWQTFGIGLPFVGHFNPDFRTLMQYPVT